MRKKSIAFVPPLQGELISTPEGQGRVVSSRTIYDMGSKNSDSEFISSIRARLGDDFVNNYYHVTVSFGEFVQKDYHCWEVEFDTDRDVEEAPWR